MPTAHRIAIVDDEDSNRFLCRQLLERTGCVCAEAADGVAALELIAGGGFELVLLDIDMPRMPGTDVLRYLRANPPSPHLKIIMISGRASGDEMAQMMQAGADDYLSKPFSSVQLQERVKALLRLRDAQNQADLANQRLRSVNHELENHLAGIQADLVHARNALVLGLAELAACRDAETGAHLQRLQHYSRMLAEECARRNGFAGQIDDHFIALLECCAPLHDIGKVGVPDQILLKPGKLTPDERRIMQQHTVLAADTLQKVAERHNFAAAFLRMAIDIARHHHERFDGTGYPDGLAGEAIPLAARMVAVADVYDALRSKRVYKPSIPHDAAVEIMLAEAGRHFDPALLAVFQGIHRRFEKLFVELAD